MLRAPNFDQNELGIQGEDYDINSEESDENPFNIFAVNVLSPTR